MNLTPNQARVLHEGVYKQNCYFHKVKMHMYQLGVPVTYALYVVFGEYEKWILALAHHLADRSIPPPTGPLGDQ
jgi:hypothetical protein